MPLLSPHRTEAEAHPSQARPEPVTGLRARHLELALKLQAVTLSHARCPAASTAFASELATALRCSRVSIGFVDGRDVRLRAVSHGGDEGLSGEAFDPISAAMDEALEQGISLYLPVGTTAVSAIRLAHSRVLNSGGGTIATVPIVHLGDGVGAVTLEWSARLTAIDTVVQELEHVVSLVGPVLYLMHLRDAPLTVRASQMLRRGWQRLRSPSGVKWRVGLVAGISALALLTLLPVSYRVGGKARIEGESQRALVAPIDGFLKTSAVRPGDRVKKNQLLIELADQDLLLEQRKWESERAQQDNAYTTALATSERAAMMIALAKADEARANLGLIESQLQRIRITAPFDGVVLQGDLSQSLGAPVQRGKVLMTLAPGDSYRVVVEIDERDIADIRVGQKGHLSLSALPWDALPVLVTRITPIARAVDGANVFDVETEVTAEAARIRPGLEGVAKIEVGQHSLAWAWLHRAADWVRMATWAWFG
jgi:Barrel-sandwich domain of CusB or HlyD membrane-fusion